MAEFVYVDEYIDEMIVFFQNTSEKAEMQLEALTLRLEKTCQLGIKEGNTANDLRAFTEQASALKTIILNYGTACSKLLSDLKDEINDIDELH